MVVLDVIKSPPGRRGGQRAVGRTDPSAKARGARTDGASRGRVGTWLGIAFVDGIANVIKAPHREWEGGSERSEQGAGVGIGILAEQPLIVLEPPTGSGRGAASEASRGQGWGLGFWRSNRLLYWSPPPGVGGGQRAKRAGGRGGDWVVFTLMLQNESGRNVPPILRGTSKEGAAGRTQSAAEPLCLYDNIATYPSGLWGWSGGKGPATGSP
jgi:hypothetical protein